MRRSKKRGVATVGVKGGERNSLCSSGTYTKYPLFTSVLLNLRCLLVQGMEI